MELVGAWRALSRRRIAVGIVFALAVLAALSTAFKLPSMERRSLSVGAATSQILVDSERSTLVAGAGPEQISALGTRARVYAQYLSSRDAVGKISKHSGVPEGLIMARGPFSQGTGISNYDQQPAESRAQDLVEEGKRFRLVFQAQEDVPIITVYSTGPTSSEALKLARSAFIVLERYIAHLKVKAEAIAAKNPDAPLPGAAAGTPVAPVVDNVVVRELGAPEGGTVGGGADKVLMLLAFVGVMGLGCFVIAALARLQEQRRLAREIAELTSPLAAGESLDGMDDAVEEEVRGKRPDFARP